MSRPKILITCKQMQVEASKYTSLLEGEGFEVDCPVLEGQQFSASEMISMLPGVVGLIAGDDELSSEVFQSTKDLRAVVRWGIGMDSVDHEAAQAAGVAVQNTPGVFNDEVADSAFGYILSLARRHHEIDAQVRSGAWPKVEGFSLAGKQLGIVGFGGIGRAVAQRGRGFGMEVKAFDPYVKAQSTETVMVDLFEELLRQSDVVVLAAPATPATQHIIDRHALKCMKSSAILINVARGSLVDEPALIECLCSGGLRGAGLDVYEAEPLPMDSPLRALDCVMLGSHNGSNTRQGVERASARAVATLRSLLNVDPS